MSPGHYISNKHEDCDRDKGNHGGDEGVAEILAKEEVFYVLEIVAEEDDIMAEIVEEAEQVDKAEIFREETTKEVVLETVAEDGWRSWRRRRRL
jgi:hypothetical protein